MLYFLYLHASHHIYWFLLVLLNAFSVIAMWCLYLSLSLYITCNIVHIQQVFSHCLRSFYLHFLCTFILFYRLIRMGICCLPKHCHWKQEQQEKKKKKHAKHFSRTAYKPTFSFPFTCFFLSQSSLLWQQLSALLFCFPFHLHFYFSFFALFCIKWRRWVDKNVNVCVSFILLFRNLLLLDLL